MWRDPELQPSCPKFVMNVQKVNTVFQHYVTSWANNTQNLFIGKDIGVLHHYRDSKGPQFDVPNPLSQKDESMLQRLEIQTCKHNDYRKKRITLFFGPTYLRLCQIECPMNMPQPAPLEATCSLLVSKRHSAQGTCLSWKDPCRNVSTFLM